MSLALLLLLATSTVTSALTWSVYSVENAASRGALCNDGTVGKYALSKATDPAKANMWMIQLEGGAFCYGLPSEFPSKLSNDGNFDCSKRASSLKSSSSFTSGPSGSTGLLSTDATANPFAGANIVDIKYCSSDFFLGDRTDGIEPTTGFYFRGRRILQSVIEDLVNLRGLQNSAVSSVAIGGSSAGGIGALAVTDIVCRHFLGNVGKCRGYGDSGFYTNATPNSNYREMSEFMRVAYRIWSVNLDGSDCPAQNPAEPWICILAPYNTHSLQTPVFLYQALYDSAFSGDLGISTSSSPAVAIRYGNEVYKAICNASLPEYSAVFSPSYNQHTALLSASATTLKIQGVSLLSFFKQWWELQVPTVIALRDAAECACNQGYNCNPPSTATAPTPVPSGSCTPTYQCSVSSRHIVASMKDGSDLLMRVQI